MDRRIRIALLGCLLSVMAGLLTLPSCVSRRASGASLVQAGAPLRGDPQVQPNKQFIGAIGDFGVGLLRATLADARSNVVVSPVSVHAALAMAANGATDETADQIRRVLRTDSMTPAETNRQWASLLLQLRGRSSEQTLDVANAMWGRKGIAFKEPFLAADRDFFGAELSVLDFGKDDVPGAINGWVSKNTRGKITRIVDQVPPNAILYLANAVYFRADWDTPFEHGSTQKSPFTRADGSKTEVDMMRATRGLPYAENAVLQATSLPYKGGDTACYVLLPNEGVSLDAAAASLEATGFSDLRRGLGSGDTTEVILGLPKLDSEFSTNLARSLAAMGMPRAFDMDNAQFSAMADLEVPIFIGRVLHKTKVKVDEKGTEAAAATVVEMRAGSSGPAGEPQQIICDRPYLFALVDEKSGAMLFLGAVNDPNQ